MEFTARDQVNAKKASLGLRLVIYVTQLQTKFSEFDPFVVHVWFIEEIR